MNKVKLALCIGDHEYQKRFVSCLMKHYQNQIELHVFADWEQRTERGENYDLCVLEDCQEVLNKENRTGTEPILYLCETEEMNSENYMTAQERGVHFVEKYQEVNRIVEEILTHISDEVRKVQETGTIPIKTRIVAVYSLSENEFQLPFSVTLASILGEGESVLLIDLQENSGFSQVMGEEGTLGLEELFVMAESGTYSKNRIASCIGHRNGMDFIYPVENTECLCEAAGKTYMKVLSMISAEREYDVLILNLGARFSGFVEVLNHCIEIYMIQKKGGLYQWREYEFMEELERRGSPDIKERIIPIEMPLITFPVTSFERLVEQWKWNEFGDLIRRMVPQENCHGQPV